MFEELGEKLMNHYKTVEELIGKTVTIRQGFSVFKAVPMPSEVQSQ